MATKPAFAQGAQVEHTKFGLGSVLSCTEEYIVIKWDDHGEKKFVLSIVLPNLKKSDRQPPADAPGDRGEQEQEEVAELVEDHSSARGEATSNADLAVAQVGVRRAAAADDLAAVAVVVGVELRERRRVEAVRLQRPGPGRRRPAHRQRR